MTRRDALGGDVVTLDASTNFALWLDRYPLRLEQEAFKQHHEAAVALIRVPEGYDRAFERRRDVLRSSDGGFSDGETRLLEIEIAGRAVLGIGAASVRETSLATLRPWGIPYIPGSALKGLASAIAHRRGGGWSRGTADGDVGPHHRALFGAVGAAGAVTFHDAWWMPEGDRIPAALDTMAVHHAGYYQGTSAPRDWDEPSPVSFLTMHGKYLVTLSGPGAALDVAEKLLREGLGQVGIGAKVNAGYGRATLAPHLSRELMQLRDFNPAVAAGTIRQVVNDFLALARRARHADEHRAAMAVASRLTSRSEDVWKKWMRAADRTDEEQLWFGHVLAPSPGPSVSSTQELTPAGTAPTTELREVRVRYVPDKKAANRFELLIEVDGQRKSYKGHLVALSADDLERVKVAGEEGAMVTLELVDGRPRRPNR